MMILLVSFTRNTDRQMGMTSAMKNVMPLRQGWLIESGVRFPWERFVSALHFSGGRHVREGPLLNVTEGSTRQLQQQHQELGRGGVNPPQQQQQHQLFGWGESPPAAAPAFPGVFIFIGKKERLRQAG